MEMIKICFDLRQPPMLVAFCNRSSGLPAIGDKGDTQIINILYFRYRTFNKSTVTFVTTHTPTRGRCAKLMLDGSIMCVDI